MDDNGAGGKGARWWLAQYPRAKRWPVPEGKDPGDYVRDHGGDLRAWVLAGLPPVLRLPLEPPAAEPPAAEEPPEEPAAEPVRCVRGVSRHGIAYLIAETPAVLAEARALYPDHVPLLRSELDHMKGFTAEQAHQVLVARQVFPDARVVGSRACG